MVIKTTFALIALAATGATPSFGAEPQRIRLTVEREDASGWRAMNPATVFAPNERLRFRLTTNFSGFLYVMNQGTAGTYELLFPRTDTGSDNRVEAGKEYVVPATEGWFRVGGPAGQDMMYWLVSPVELPRGYQRLPPPPPHDSGARSSLRPRCDDTVFKARGECVDNSAGVRPVQPGEKLPSNLSGVAGATPRELLFLEEKGGTVLSSKQPLTGPVIYELRLAHR
ncbi:MAG TPA: DUF4384 domain-containing protein [Bryobacteraceae bacterium]|jgi:hypothetical protein|nr:DUF4384 domain-containing protein [Bryobacteraceae bacterium]